MYREEVFYSISTERDFQDEMTKRNDRPDMINEFHVGDALSAIQHNLNLAREAWYKDSIPHQEAMVYLRKIAALCVKQGEVNGMPIREVPEEV